MQQQKILIKGMVCQRCISTVKNEFERSGLQLDEVNLGEVTLSAHSPNPVDQLLKEKLQSLGFSLLEDKNLKLVKALKDLVAEVYSGSYDFPHRFRFAELVTKELGKEYDFISAIFSQEEKTTVEKYIIHFRIEKVKEMLAYSNSTLADISFRLGFSSVAHLSRQFKMQTGVNPSYFKNIKLTHMAAVSAA
jgi:AraC family transcriptional regulator